jgi:hypothetical protein
MKTSAQDSLDHDNHNYLVNVQKVSIRSSIRNKEMTMHRFLLYHEYDLNLKLKDKKSPSHRWGENVL